MEARDKRMESLLAQTMQHMMAMVSRPGGDDGLSPDSDMGYVPVQAEEEDL